MRTFLTPRLAACLGVSAAILAAATWTSGAAAQQEIGDVELVRVWATGTPPESNKRDLVVEDQVFRNEFVETVRDGALHLRFLDETEFRLGSNSRAVLDSFVFDPDTDSGEIALTLSKGLFRYVSGKLKGEKITIKTPTATVGLRGTVVTIFVGPDGETIVDVDEGEAFLRALNSDAVRAVTAATQMAKADRSGKISSFDGALPKDSGLEAKGGHEGRAGMKTSNTGRGVKSRLGRGSASNGQTVSALAPEAVLDLLSRQVLLTRVTSVVAAPESVTAAIQPPAATIPSEEIVEATTETNGGGGSSGPFELPGVEVGLFTLESPNQEGVVYNDVFTGAILSRGPAQGDVVDYALIGDFPDQTPLIDDIGFGGTEGTITLVPGTMQGGKRTIPLESTVLAFGAPPNFIWEITGTVDGGPSGIPGQVVALTSSGNPISQDFDLEVGETAVVAITTVAEQGLTTVINVLPGGSVKRLPGFLGSKN